MNRILTVEEVAKNLSESASRVIQNMPICDVERLAGSYIAGTGIKTAAYACVVLAAQERVRNYNERACD